MTVNYLPGRPVASEQSVSFVNWHTLGILAYCSGNNLIIITKNFESLQTIYLVSDARCCDINKHNGKIAVTVQSKILVYKPVIQNYYDYTFYTNRKNANVLNIHWELELEINNEADASHINCINWSDNCESLLQEENNDESYGGSTSPNGASVQVDFNTETSSELVTGSDKSLTLWRLYYKNKKSHSEKTCQYVKLWSKIQPSPVYQVKLSPDTSLIASCGKYDKLVKIWRRLTFGIEEAEFDLSYAKHPSYVTSFRWRNPGNDTYCNRSRAASTSTGAYTSISRFDSNSLHSFGGLSKSANILYTFSTDSIVRIFSSFEADSKHMTQFNGSVSPKFEDSGMHKPIFANIIDHELLEFGVNSMIEEMTTPANGSKEANNNTNFLKVPKLRNRSDSSLSITQEKEMKITQLINKGFEVCVFIDCNGFIEFQLLENISQTPPKLVKAIKTNKSIPIQLSANCFPKKPRYLAFQDFAVSKYYDDKTDAFDYCLSLVYTDLEKGSIRHVEFLFSDIINRLLESEKLTSLADLDDDSSFFVNQEEAKREHKSPTIGALQHKFSGHDKSIQKLRRSVDGTAVLSLSRFGESHLWTPTELGNRGHQHKHHVYSKDNRKHLHYYNGTGVTLSRKSMIDTSSAVLDAVVLNNGGDFVLTLMDEEIIMWNCRMDAQNTKISTPLVNYKIKSHGAPLSFFLLPEKGEGVFHAVAIYSKNELSSWEITIDPQTENYGIASFQIQNFPDDQENIHLISAIDPVGWEYKLNDANEFSYKYDIKSSQQRDILSIIDIEGNLRTYSATLSKKDSVITWYLKSHNKTHLQNVSNLKGSSINKCAIVDSEGKKLSIWDTKTNFLEYEEDLSNEIYDLDWTCTNDNGVSILAVTLGSRVLLYSQLRYDYTNESPSYAAIRSIDISDKTSHDIGDSIWLQDGTLLIGAGNQCYIVDKSLDVTKDVLSQRVLGSKQILHNDIFTLGMVVNGPLPFFHPQFLIQSLFLEKFEDVKRILVELYSNLRDIELDPNGDIWKDIIPSLNYDVDKFISAFLKTGILSKGSAEDGFHSKYHALNGVGHDTDEREFNWQLALSLVEKLQRVKLPFLTGHQQITLVSVIEIVEDINSNFRSVLDSNGLRYYLGLKLYQLNTSKIGFDGTISTRDISFAYHSENKDLLFNIVNEVSHSRLSWSVAKNYGLVYWLSNEKLIEQFEKIAKNEFLKFSDNNNGRKDPTSCSIFYLALKRKQIVIGLWKMSIGHREQQKMVKFLSNDFKDKRWKTAALKNAFALMSKHRYLDAANFFLLGDSLRDCVNVIIKQLKDVELAIGVARCYEARDNGPVFQYILTDHLLPSAIDLNNRWLKSYVYSMLKQQRDSIQCLIDDEFVDKQVFPTTSLTLEPKKKSFLEYDPVLIVLYQSLRKTGVSSSNEYRFITNITNIYNRMGCDALSLYIVKNWSFNYGQVDAFISSLSTTRGDESTISTAPANKLTEDLKLGSGNPSEKKFVEAPASLEFDISAFDF